MGLPARLRKKAWRALCMLLGHHITNGLAVAVGLMLVTVSIYLLDDLSAASAGAVGALIATLPDMPAQKRHKFQQLLPVAALGAPLYLAMQLAHESALQQGAVLVCGTFVAFMGTAWGKRGGPLSAGLMFSMLFSMASPAAGFVLALERTGWFVCGAGLYMVYAVAANGLLNARYRVQLLAATLLEFAEALRSQSRRFSPYAESEVLTGDMLRRQAALADTLQAARDVVLESPRTPQRQKLAGMLLSLLEARDQLVACELDTQTLSSGDLAALPPLADALAAAARQIDVLATALLLGRRAADAQAVRIALGRLYPADARAPAGDAPSPPAPALSASVRDAALRVAAIGDEVERLFGLARGDEAPELATVRENWQLFISPTGWSWTPLKSERGWYGPTLRQALRAAAAIGTGFAIALHLPWGTHKYWVLITITVVMRANLAQTLQRRNARIAGTLLGCLVVMAFLSTHPRPIAILGCIAIGAAIGHAFVVRRYLITATAATTQGMLQAHLLNAGAHPAFAVGERIGDTLIGAVIAWLFSYVLPVWERDQVPRLVQRVLRAQARHARLALTAGVERAPDVDWRLGRREAYDSLSALGQAAGRTLSEPARVQLPLEPLETLQAQSYRLLAQLTAVKSTLQLRRGQLQMELVAPALERTATAIEEALNTSAASGRPEQPEAPEPPDDASMRPPDALADDLTPWLLGRLALAQATALRLRRAADRALG
ncbi:FUSC family protein [Xylophilus sp. ASV27]|uniref:FUSC family protein n=1 Tax=Xylophilus sp. ASV27 TaxID=2795129 RepID=UPI0018EC2DFF|nr:FUSC family protein [Xylophilus sp. ASV27]